MPGRPDFSQAGTAGGGQVLATNPRPEVVEISADQTTSLASASSEVTEVYAPAGSVYNLQALQVQVDADGTATSGTHTFVVRPLDAFGVLYGESNYNTEVRYQFGYWYTADVEANPTTEAAQEAIQSRLKATENSPLVVRYDNDTNAAQDNTRLITLIVDEVSY